MRAKKQRKKRKKRRKKRSSWHRDKSIKKMTKDHPSAKSKNKKKAMGTGKAVTKRKGGSREEESEDTPSKVYQGLFFFLFVFFCFVSSFFVCDLMRTRV